MKRPLGPLLLAALMLCALLLSGCGASDSSDVATDTSSPTTSPTTSPSMSPSPTKGGTPADGQVVALVSQTAAGGTVDTNAVRLDDQSALAAFIAQFRRGLDRKVTEAVDSATVPSGQVLIGAVVSIGCDVPPGVTVTVDPDGYVLVPQPVPSPLKECFAPVTTVAIATVTP